MRFCAVFRHYPKDTPGGAEFQSYLIERELARRGHDVHYVAYQSGTTQTTTDEGISLHRLQSDVDPADAPKLVLEEIKSINPDYVYLRNFSDLPLADHLDDWIDGEIIFNISHDRQCLRLRNNPRETMTISNIYQWVNEPWRLFKKRLFQLPDYRFAQTEYQQDLLKENFGLTSSYIGNGHPIPEDIADTRNPPTILWLASLKSWKQPMKFIEIAEACEDLNCQFWLVGRPANTELMNTIDEHLDNLSNIAYKGGCGIKESNTYIRDSDIFVNTSVKEGFPNTFIQSWLRKTPVVSLNVDPDNLLQKYDIGTSADGDFEKMVADLRCMIENTSYRNDLGVNARSYAKSNHSMSAVVSRIECSLGLEEQITKGS